MHAVAVYLDECVDQNIVAYLQRRGFVVRTARSQGMTAASDADQIRHAHANRSLLLTTNIRDYARLHAIYIANDDVHSGIITLPDTPISARLAVRSVMMLDWIAVEFPDPRNQLFRWTDLQQQIIGGYILTEYTEAEIALALGRATTLS